MSYLVARPPAAGQMQQVVEVGTSGDWQPAHRRAEAERATAAALAQLGPQWRVLHSLPVGPGPATLAHLVVGPQGLYAISSLPRAPTVLEVDGGRPRLSLQGGDEALAEARQLAQRVHGGLRQRLATAVDLPPVQPVLCLTDGDEPPQGEQVEGVTVSRLLARLEARPRLVPAAAVQRLAALCAEPSTWDAPPTETLPPDLQARYEAVVHLGGGVSAAVRPAPDDRVIPGEVTVAGAPKTRAGGVALRSGAVLMVLLGMSSLATAGLLSPPSLAYGGLTLRSYGGLKWLNDKDAALFQVGMVLAALPLPLWVLLLPFLLGRA